MKVLAKADRPQVRFDVDTEVNLMISLTAPDIEANQKRNPLSIVAVLDRSGSMAQQNKMVNLRKTMYKLIDNLTEDDSLGLVFFDSQTTFVKISKMDSANKELFKREIANTDPRGGTDMGSGLAKAVDMFSKFEGPVKGVERILLLTDGEANEGATEIGHFEPIVAALRANIGLSTFGYGVDYNENLLSAISRQGKGANYYVENLDSVARAFGTELGALLTCYAQEIKLSLKPHPGTRIVNVLNDFDVTTDEDDDGNMITTVDVGDIFRNETKKILVRLVAQKREKPLPREVTLADVNVSYRTLDTAKQEQVLLKPKFAFVKDAADATKTPDPEVAEQVALLEAALNHEKAKAMADAGNWQGAKAVLHRSYESLASFDSPIATAYACSIQEDADMMDATYSAQSVVSKKMSNSARFYRSSGRGNVGNTASAYAAGVAGGHSNVAMGAIVQSFVTQDDVNAPKAGTAGTATAAKPQETPVVKKAGYTKARKTK